MARPETTPTRRGSQDKLETPPSEDDFESPREPRKASTRRPPLSPTSPNTGRTPAGARTARESTRRLHIVDNDGDDGDCSLPEEESEDEKPNASKGRKRKRKKPTASKRKGKKKIRHDYRDVDPEYADMTTERLFNERHISTGKFSYNHPLFAMEAAAFNDAKVNGKEVWQKQPSGPSTLHNSIVIADHFTSLAHFLRQLEKLCKPRPTTDRLFLKQRAQQYTKSGRQHRDGKNAPWRMCATVHDPAAPLNIKQLEIGVADASKAKGGRAVNPFQTKADGTTDAVRFNCPSGSYHIMDIVATGLVSHAHHQAIIDKSLLPVHGALTTFVLDLDPINPETFIEDVAEIARGTADEVGAGVGVSAPVPPPTPGQIGQSCGSTQTSDWNKLQQEENAENYLQDRRDAANSCHEDGCSCETAGEGCTCVDHVHVKNSSVGGATLATGANQVGSAPSNGAAASTRRAIPGAPDPARAHGFCFGFGADGEGLAAKLKRVFAGENGCGDGPITLDGCNTPNFGEAGVTKGKSSWKQDDKGYLVLGVHNGVSTEEHPSCSIGGTVPVERGEDRSWRLCKWALPFVANGKIVSAITHRARFNGAPQKYHGKKRAQK